METVCLSSASILRCSSLTQIENIALIIPSALGAIFSTGLIFIYWGTGSRRHLLLAGEGWMYFGLALLEMLSYVLPSVRDHYSLFRALDLAIGVASFLPIFFYTFFLYLFASAEIVENLPRRIKNVSKLTLILFIPAIVICNEVASFVGVSITRSLSRSAKKSVIIIGFSSEHSETLWTFFTAFTLALLTAFQAAIFCFSFFRLIQALLHQRRIENDKKEEDKAHLVRGVGWISAAAKLGAVETLIGFAGGGFGVVLTRRIIRLLGRACLCIGVVRGVDGVEDFRAIRSEFHHEKGPRREFRRSRLHLMISNPRNSTFQSLSPTATAFHSAPRAAPTAPGSLFITQNGKGSNAVKPPHYLTFTHRQSLLNMEKGIPDKGLALPSMAHFADIKDRSAKQRVTVLYSGGTPKLYMRFSKLDLPSPAVIVEKVKSRPPSEWSVEAYRKSRMSYSAPPSTRAGTPYLKDSDEVFDLPVPQPFFQRNEKTRSSSFRDSSLSSPSSLMTGPFEIVTVPQQTLVTAQPRFLQTNVDSNGHDVFTESPTSISPVAAQALPVVASSPTPQPLTQSRPQAQRSASDVSRKAESRMTHISVRSVPDSIEAVRELAGQFPGPPQARISEVAQRRPRSILWEESTEGSEVDYTVAQAVGSPSQLTFGHTAGEDESTTSWGNSRRSSLTFGGTGRAQITAPPVPKGGPGYAEKPIDPFADDDEDGEAYNPPVMTRAMTRALRQSLGAKAAKALAKSMRNPPAQLPLTGSPDASSPATAFSEVIGYAPDAEKPIQDNQFLDTATALGSGKSKQFMPIQPPPPSQAPPKTPPSARPVSQRQASEEKLARVAEWVDTSASPEVTRIQAAEEPVRDNRSLQNLHDRGKSIDNLTIPWLKDSETMEEDERKLARAMGTPKRPGGPMRLKSVGKVPQLKSTPSLTHTAHTRASVYLEPIIVPPRKETLPQVERLMDFGSMESTSTGHVLRDSTVFGVADSVYVTQKAGPAF